MSKPIGLALLGYNYTDRQITAFSVTDQAGNSTFGGNVALSSPGSGGSGSSCCVMLRPNETQSVRLKVEWTLDGVREKYAKPGDGEKLFHGTVTIAPPYPKRPNNLEIHFYPDGHLEGVISEFPSDPRIVHPEGTPGT